jgi:hypothetical protein
MNGRTQGLSWAMVVAVVTLIATQGRPLIDALSGLPALLQAWSAGMPLGALSFLISLGVAAGACAFLLRWLPACDNDAGRHFIAETATIVAAVCVSVGQAWSQDSGKLLSALWLGLIAGFAAPWVVRGIRAAIAGRKP